MSAFANAVRNIPTALTENGAATYATSGEALVDLFFQIGSASKGVSTRVNVIDLYKTASRDDKERAIRTMLWMRDVRECAGRRQAFRDWLLHLETSDPETLALVLPHVPKFGRWDDVLIFTTDRFKAAAYFMCANALRANDGLCAKWMPRKGQVAVELRAYMGLTPKRYRKMLVERTQVVESQMCANQWAEINYSHVPSLASTRYKKAFFKRDQERFASYVAELTKPVEQRDPSVKVNAGAVYPFDIVRSINGARYGNFNTTVADHAQAQWDALPNFVGSGKRIIPVVDVSGSMGSAVQGNVTAMDVSTSLGMYLAEKNDGPFKNLVLTFSEHSRFVELHGTLTQRYGQILGLDWGMSTNVQAAFDEILKVALQNRIHPSDMPSHILIISDMEFNSCVRGVTNFQLAKAKFAAAGYKLPNVVFWNVNARSGNSPVRADTSGVALVSGFSPSIAKSVLSAERMDPSSMVDAVIMKERYNIFN